MMNIQLYTFIYKFKLKIFNYKCKKEIICYDNINTIFKEIHEDPLYSKYISIDGYLHYILM